MNKIFLVGLFVLSLFFQADAQSELKDYQKGDLLSFGIGFVDYKIRDLGASPLFYEGTLLQGHLDWITESEKWFSHVYGTYGYDVLLRTELETYGSTIHAINHGGSLLYRVWKADNKPLDLKVGGLYNGSTNIRFNPDFRNAANTVESINSIMLSGRLEWIFDSNKEKRKLLWLIPLKPGRRVSKLTYQLNLPIVNLIWSPKFPYLDDFTEGTVDYGNRNEFKTGGIRLSSSLSYQYYLLNGNALRFQYVWDAFSGPEDFGQIEWAQHQFQASIMIRLSELKSLSPKN